MKLLTILSTCISDTFVQIDKIIAHNELQMQKDF